MRFERVVGAFIVIVILAVVGGISYAIWYSVNDPGHGTITKKQYNPAYTTTQCTTTNNITTCVPEFHGECYEVDYTDGHHDGDSCLSQQEYNSYNVGDYYPRRSK